MAAAAAASVAMSANNISFHSFSADPREDAMGDDLNTVTMLHKMRINIHSSALTGVNSWDSEMKFTNVGVRVRLFPLDSKGRNLGVIFLNGKTNQMK